jgi:pyridoxamine 5'-phosphate oxidase
MELYNDLLPDPLPAEPMALAGAWLATAWRRASSQTRLHGARHRHADGQPSARVVLCKELDAELGRVSFVTNYDSRKGRELVENARAALVFHWDHAHRQVRVEGVVVKAPARRVTPTSRRATGSAASAPGPAHRASRCTRASS